MFDMRQQKKINDTIELKWYIIETEKHNTSATNKNVE